MAGRNEAVGTARYQTEVDASGVTKGLDQADRKIKDTGAQVEKAFGTQATGAVSKFSGGITGLLGKFNDLSKKGGVTGAVLGGVGLGAGLSAFGLVQGAIGGVADALGGAVQAAIDDEKATAQLNQTIKANVKGWDGNNEAVDSAIAKGAQLAFTDDDVRDGLNQLIPRTHDIAQANKLNALAMDLARAKGMSLGEAATLVGKAYSGQASALKRVGINIKNTKDSTAALAELQKMVSGQADKYAGTTQGAMERMDIATSEAMESIGYAIKPVVAAFAGLAADVISGVSGVASAFDTSNAHIDKGIQFINDYGAALEGVTPEVQALTKAQADLAKTLVPSKLQVYTEAFDSWVASSADGLQQETLSLQALRGEAAGTFDIAKWMTDLSRSFAMASGVGGAELGKLAQKVALAGGDFDDFVLAIQGVAAASVDLKGIGESYRKTFDPMTRTIEQFTTEWQDGAARVMSGKETWQEWGQFLVRNTDYIKAHFEEMPKWMQDVVVKQGIVLGHANGVVSKYAAEGLNQLNLMWQGMEVGAAAAGKGIYGGLVPQVKHTFHAMFATMDSQKQPWIAAWKDFAAFAKDPFRPKMFEDWLAKRAHAAAKKAADAPGGLEGPAGRYWTALSEVMLDPVLNKLATTREQIEALARAMVGFDEVNSHLGNFGRNFNGPAQNHPGATRASGGYVMTGQTYLVGENGPELLTMGDRNGYVTPNNRLAGNGTMTHLIDLTPRAADALRGAGFDDRGVATWLRDAVATSGHLYATPRRS